MLRHYVTQRSPAAIDARMVFKLETSQPRRGGPIKPQPEWVGVFADLLRRKRSNIQFGYMVSFTWDVKGLTSRTSLRLITDAWSGLEPLLDLVRGRETRR